MTVVNTVSLEDFVSIVATGNAFVLHTPLAGYLYLVTKHTGEEQIYRTAVP